MLSSLVDKSLVIKEDVGSRALYRLHETMREYARLQAGARQVRKRSSSCAAPSTTVARCRRSAAEARYRLVEWLDWMDLEIDNIRSVLHRCLAGQDLAAGAGADELAELVLGHPRDQRRRPLARRVPRAAHRSSPARAWPTSCAGSWPCCRPILGHRPTSVGTGGRRGPSGRTVQPSRSRCPSASPSPRTWPATAPPRGACSTRLRRHRGPRATRVSHAMLLQARALARAVRGRSRRGPIRGRRRACGSAARSATSTAWR